MQQQAGLRPISLVCIAAPDDNLSLAQWETHLLPLQQAGRLSLWSEHALQAGDERGTQLTKRLDQASVIVLLLSADFFANTECLTLMNHALRRSRDGTARVLPLLVRPVLWRESPVGALACLPANEVPVLSWERQDEGWHACVLGLQRLLGVSSSRARQTPASTRDHSDRGCLLRWLSRDYQRNLEESLQHLAWLELGLSEQPDAVRNATHLLARRPDHSERALPAGTTILDAYDQAEEALLILGEPGTGKSTLLRELALQLITRAQEDDTHPLPVILPLSSWAVSKLELSDWMVEQLARIYDVPRRLGRSWVNQDQILPLLDGLDEMEEAVRPLCIAAINAYRKAHFTPLVICSRSAEYQAASVHQRLLLQNAVVVQPLTQAQVERELQLGGEPLAALREALWENEELRNLVTTPLMLSVIVLAYHSMTALDLPQQQKELEYRVWTDYVERMVREKGAEKHEKGDIPVKCYSLKDTSSFLGWLAQQMRKHNQAVFYGEYLQKSWLAASTQRVARWLTDLLPAVFLGIVSSLLLTLFLSEFTDSASLCRAGLLGGFLGWCFYLYLHNNISSKTQRTGVRHFVHIQGLYLLRSLGLAPLLVASWNIDPQDWTIWREGIIDGITFLLGMWLLQGVLFKQPHQSKFLRVSFISWWKRVTARPRIIRVCRVIWKIIVSCSMVALYWNAGEMIALANDSLSSLPYIGLTIIGTFFLGFWLYQAAFLSQSHWKRLVIWFQQVSIRQAFWTMVIFSASFALSTVLSYWQKYGWRAGLNYGLSYGVGYSLIFGLPFGATVYLLHRILGQQIETVRLAELISWTWCPLLSFRHLRISLYLVLAALLLFGGSYWLIENVDNWFNFVWLPSLFPHLWSNWFGSVRSTGLAFGLSLGLSYWLLLGIYEGMLQKHMGDQDRRRFNQGLHRSLWNGGFLSLLGTIIICSISVLNGGLNNALVFILGNGLDNNGFQDIGFSIGMHIGLGGGDLTLSHVVSSGLRDGISVVWFTFFYSWFVLWMATGGLTILRHYILRILLVSNYTFPLNARHFLDDACARVLLRRIGGGYGFMHRRLLDYFADTALLSADASQAPHQASSVPQSMVASLPGTTTSERFQDEGREL